MKITEFHYVGTHNSLYKDYCDGIGLLLGYEGKYEEDPIRIGIFVHSNNDKSTIEFIFEVLVDTDRIYLSYCMLPEIINVDINDYNETLAKMMYSPEDYIRRVIEQKGNIGEKIEYISEVLDRATDYLKKCCETNSYGDYIFFAHNNCRKYAVKANGFIDYNKYHIINIGCNRVGGLENIEGYTRVSANNKLYTVGVTKIYRDYVIRQYVLLEFIKGDESSLNYAPLTYNKLSNYFSLAGEVKNIKLSKLETSIFNTSVLTDRLIEQYGIVDSIFEEKMREIDNGTYTSE